MGEGTNPQALASWRDHAQQAALTNWRERRCYGISGMFSAVEAALAGLNTEGLLLAPERSAIVECRVDWVDLCGECPGRTKRQDYDWERAAFEDGLAREVAAAVRFDWQPARITKRTVSTRIDDSTLITAWAEVLG